MKFIKGFLVTIALYVGLSMLFTVLGTYLISPEAVGSLFSSLASIAPMFHASLSNPIIFSVFQGTMLYIAAPTNLSILFLILGSVVPVVVAALIGSLAEKKSGSVKYIFLSTFLGLLIAATLGIIFKLVGEGMLVDIDATAKFLTSGLIMSALNAFIWCAIGVFVTSKGWG